MLGFLSRNSILRTSDVKAVDLMVNWKQSINPVYFQLPLYYNLGMVVGQETDHSLENHYVIYTLIHSEIFFTYESDG
jgi:hypothetical protein